MRGNDLHGIVALVIGALAGCGGGSVDIADAGRPPAPEDSAAAADAAVTDTRPAADAAASVAPDAPAVGQDATVPADVVATTDAAPVVRDGPATAVDGMTAPMSFFVASVGVGRGGDLGGLAGADRHCVMLARAAGSTRTTWVAYLSVTAGPDGRPVHARERIGAGPWHNARGELLARTVAELHPRDPPDPNGTYARLRPRPELFRDETGQPVTNASSPHDQDIFTGSTHDGRAYDDSVLTCRDWTNGTAMPFGVVGHPDLPTAEQIRMNAAPTWISWNWAHRAPCTATPRSGRVYCFAPD